ncbi:MAG: hypothetical protein JSR32_04040 [Proteobacteria bacterium]|nr:hypothetical protein [Pseudomonadota bacterium]
MEYFSVSNTEKSFHIEGFPDAVKIITINDPDKARSLADLSLHQEDLEFADACLDALNQTNENPIAREALWRSAIVHYMKCFGNGVRFQLKANKIYECEPQKVLLAFEYFKDLRNKHFIHDVNSYAQSIPGAVLNNGTKDYKIEKIVCFTAFGETLEQGNYRNLKLLIEKARAWVVSEFDSLCEELTEALEKECYDKLLSRESINYYVPTIEDISRARKIP